MRSIRRAALAGATAASLVLGAASVAVAQETTDGTTTTADETTTSDKGSSMTASGLSSDNDKDKDSDTDGTDKKDEDKTGGSSAKLGNSSEGGASNISSNIGDKLEADLPANGERLWGSSKDVEKEPKWARIMRAITITGVIGSILGLVVFPAYNFVVYNYLVPGHR